MKNSSIEIHPIGKISTPFSQIFGIPRQPVLATHATGHIHFNEDIDSEQACRGLNQFSHLWLLFLFHHHQDKATSMTVRPPRLGGKTRIGVFASRSSYRPNNIGLSVVKNLGYRSGILSVSGLDLLDQTPIIDIKPYISYSDAIADANCGYAQTPPPSQIEVNIHESVRQRMRQTRVSEQLLVQVLSQDPRPAHEVSANTLKHYWLTLYDVDFEWRLNSNSEIEVISMRFTSTASS